MSSTIRINGVDRPSQTHVHSTTNFGMYHMHDNRNIYEPQRSTDFEFVVTDIDGIEKLNGIGTHDNDQEMIRLAVVDCPVPHFSINALEERRGNSVQKFAGEVSFSSGTLTIRDWIGAETKAILMAWQNEAYDVATDKVGLMSGYKKDCYLIEYTPDKQKVRQWIMYGCWISDIQEDDFSHDSSNNRSVRCTIQYDKAIVDNSDLS